MKMTLHRALAELKMLNKRILGAVNEQKYVGYHIGDENPRGYSSVEDFVERARKNYQSVNALMDRRNEIKSKLILANATTKVKIAGVEMTIAEAIDQKDFIDYKQALLNELKRQLSLTTQSLDHEKQDMLKRLDKRIDSDLGSKERKDHAKEVEEITANFIKRNGANVLDPINIREEIEALDKEIHEFTVEVDAVLSEANALTTIDISE